MQVVTWNGMASCIPEIWRNNTPYSKGTAPTKYITYFQPPLILNFDMQAGTVSGVTCANCTVEIFSDGSDEGTIYEGQAVSDGNGAFTFEKGAPLSGRFLTATTTDPDGTTSEFSPPAH